MISGLVTTEPKPGRPYGDLSQYDMNMHSGEWRFARLWLVGWVDSEIASSNWLADDGLIIGGWLVL